MSGFDNWLQSEVERRSLIPSTWEEFAPLTNIRSSGRVVPFTPYDFQVELIRTIERSPSTCLLKSRQIGASESICNWILMRAVTEQGFTGIVFSKTLKDSSDLAARIKSSAMSLGRKCPEFVSESKTHLEFKGLGQIFFLPSTARAARGIPSCACIFMDEAAFIDNAEGLFQAVIPTMSMLGDRGRVILASTPNPGSNLFRSLWFDDSGNWAKVRIHYSQHPVYNKDPEWAEKTRRARKLTEEAWKREFELDWGDADSGVFKRAYVDRALTGAWQKPQWLHTYLAGIDPSFGGGDYFCVRVWDVTQAPYQLVAQYRANYTTGDVNLARSLELLDPYAPAMVAVETNSGGRLILEELLRLRPGWEIQGVNINNASKIVHTDRLVLQLERGHMLFPPDAADEYLHFVERLRGATRIREAESGNHDDTVMADAIAFAHLEIMPAPTSYSAAAGGSSAARGIAREL